MSYILGQKKIAQMIGVRSDTPIISPTRFYESVEERDNDTDNRIIGDLAVIEDKGPIPAPDIFTNVAELSGLISKGLKTVVNRDFIPQYENYVYEDGPHLIYVANCMNDTYSAGDIVKYVQSVVAPLDENGNIMSRSQLNQGDRIFGGAILLVWSNGEAQDIHCSATHISPSLLNLESFTSISDTSEISITIDKTRYDENGYLLNEYILNIDEELYTYLLSPNDAFLEFSKIYQQRFNATVELKVGDKFNELRFDKMLYHLYASPFTDNNPMLPLFRLSEGDILNHELLLFRCDSTTGIPNINGDCFITVMVKIEGIGEKTVQKLTVIGSSLDIPTGFTFGGVTSDPVVKEWNNLTINFDSEATVEEIMYVPTEGNPDWTKHLILAPPIEGTKGVKSILNPERKYIDFKEGEGGSTTPIVQTTGDSITDVMSQKAVTDELNKVAKELPYFTVDLNITFSDRNNIAQDKIYSFFGGENEFNRALQQFEDYYQGPVVLKAKQISGETTNLICDWLIYYKDSVLSMKFDMSPGYGIPADTSVYLIKSEGLWSGKIIINTGLAMTQGLLEGTSAPSVELSRELFAPNFNHVSDIEQELDSRRLIWNDITKTFDMTFRTYVRTFTGILPPYDIHNQAIIRLDSKEIYTSAWMESAHVFTDQTLINSRVENTNISILIQNNILFFVSTGQPNMAECPYIVTVLYTKK